MEHTYLRLALRNYREHPAPVWLGYGLGIGVVVVWIVLQLLFAFPETIVDDWMGWRQADTQSIIDNFRRYRHSILYPQINWGGSGPGFVASEFPIYAYFVAQLSDLFAVEDRAAAEFVGAAVSLFSIALAALALLWLMIPRFGSSAATMGILAMLSVQGIVFVSSSVQPDGLALFFYTLGFVACVNWLDSPVTSHWLCLLVMMTVLAGLTKPTALHIGIAYALLVCFTSPQQLLKKGTWFAAVAMALVFCVYLWHSHQLYQNYGNTFGVAGEGDSKFPTLTTLSTPWYYSQLLVNGATWGGLGLLFLCLLYFLLRRSIDGVSKAFLISLAALNLVAFRYMSDPWNGPHYHIFTAILLAWMVARMMHDLQLRWIRWRLSLITGVAIILIGNYFWVLHERHSPRWVLAEQQHVNLAARALVPLVDESDLIVVRSSAKSYDDRFNTVNNFEDPRIFYIAGVRGWVMAVDDFSLEKLTTYCEQGARFYIDPFGISDEHFNRWLTTHSQLVKSIGRGLIYRLPASKDCGEPAF